MTDLEDIRLRYGPEMAFIILVYRVYFKTAEPVSLEVFAQSYTPDWGKTSRIARFFKIRPAVNKVLSVYPVGIGVEFLDDLRNQNRVIAVQNLDKLKELIQLNKAFDEKGIALVPYKGALLSQLLHGDYISRETVDTDFLIRPQDFSAVRNLFLQLGYKSNYYYSADYESYLLKRDAEYQFYKEMPNGTTSKIEIHWNVIHKMEDITIKNEDLLNRLEVLQLPGASVRTLNLEDTLLIMLIHHGVNDIWRSLKHVSEIALFLDKYSDKIDWISFRKKLVDMRILNVSMVGFTMAEQLFGVNAPADLIFPGKLTEDVMDDILDFPPKNTHKLVLGNFYRQLALRDSFLHRLRLTGSYILTAITPNMRDVQRLPLPYSFRSLYWILKPFMLFRKRNN
jgi:hypothetical protein